MLARLSPTTLRSSIINQVSFSLFSLSPLKYHLSTISSSLTNSPSSSSSSSSSSSNCSHKLSTTHLESPLVGKLVLSKCSTLWNHDVDTFSTSSASLSELLLRISHISPETCRKFLRVSNLKPEHVLEIVSNFDSGCGNPRSDARIVESLWEIFKRVAFNNEGFKQLPRSCEVMAYVLIRAGMLREVESLLSTMENQGILLVSDEIFSGIIEGYVNASELERALMMYDQMKGQCLVPSMSCYRSLLDLLIKEHKSHNALCIYEDLVDLGFEFGNVEARNLEILIRLLCRDGKIKEARKLLKKIVATGWKPSTAVLSEVADVYCEKKDFEDLLNFFIEMKCAPNILVGNKIIYSLCSHFGIERAHLFLWELEHLGFSPNEITFGIFISWSCLKGNLRDAFVYLSEILSRGLKPDRHSYNALISGLFKGGMHEHAQVILNEMIENGIKPTLTTFRALLAGYSKARRFNDVKRIIGDMLDSGLIVLSPLEDSISKAFCVLGLNPLTVKVKRDNDVSNFRTEFMDELGNGLYLDTNLEEFEKTITGVVEESLIPDFNFLITRQCNLKNVKEALLMVDEMIHWGQELSLPVLSVLMRLLCESNRHIEKIPGLLDKLSRSFAQLDHETLNLLVQALSKMEFRDKSRLLVDEMNRRHLPITKATYTALLVGLCKNGGVHDVLHYWDLARKDNWFPEWNDFVTILGYLCQRRMLKELLELFDIMLVSNPNLRKQICDVFLEKLCSTGFTRVAHILVNELEKQGSELDHTVYSHLIKGYFQEKRFSEPLIIFDRILPDNLALSPDALLLLIPRLCKANRVENAVAFKDTGLRYHPSISYSLYSALIKGCCRAGKVPEASGLFQEMFLKNIIPNDEIYNTLFQGYCQINDLKTVKELLCVMMRRTITLPVSSYRNLVSLLCKKEMFCSAMGLKRLMLIESKFSSLVIYNILIFYLFQKGKIFLVDELLDELEEMGLKLDEVCFNFLIYGFSICKDMSKSMKYLNDMIFKDLIPSNRSLRTIIYYLSRNGQVQKALQLSNQIESRGWIHGSTVNYALLEGLFSHCRIDEAERILARIMDKGFVPENINYDSIIRKLCVYGRLETAVNLLDQMLKKRRIPDSVSYDCIIQSFCGYYLDRAMDFFNEMLARNLKPSTQTWDLLIEKLCVNGRTVEAESLLTSMLKFGEIPTKGMYSSVIDRYRFEKNLSKASELLQKMQQHGYEPDFMTQWSLISCLSKSTDQEVGAGNGGFLSKLLLQSGFPSESGTKSKQH